MAWEVRYACAKCLQLVSFNQVMNSHAVCPHCGHGVKGTVMDTVKTSVYIEPKIKKRNLLVRILATTIFSLAVGLAVALWAASYTKQVFAKALAPLQTAVQPLAH